MRSTATLWLWERFLKFEENNPDNYLSLGLGYQLEALGLKGKNGQMKVATECMLGIVGN